MPDEHFSHFINPHLQQAVCLRALQHGLFIYTINSFDFDTKKGYADECAFDISQCLEEQSNSKTSEEKQKQYQVPLAEKKRMVETDQVVPPYITFLQY